MPEKRGLLKKMQKCQKFFRLTQVRIYASMLRPKIYAGSEVSLHLRHLSRKQK